MIHSQVWLRLDQCLSFMVDKVANIERLNCGRKRLKAFILYPISLKDLLVKLLFRLPVNLIQ